MSCIVSYPFPQELLPVIGHYATDKGTLVGNSTDYHFGRSKGSPEQLDFDIAVMRADDIVRYTLEEVRGDVTQLNSSKKDLLERLGPHVRYLDMTGFRVTGDLLASIIGVLALRTHVTALHSLVVTSDQITADMLRTLAARKIAGDIPQLVHFGCVDKQSVLHRIGHDWTSAVAFEEEDFLVLQESGILNGLVSLTCRNLTSPTPDVLAECKALKEFRLQAELDEDGINALDEREIFKRLQCLSIKIAKEAIERLAQVEMHLDTLELDFTGCPIMAIHDLAKSGALQKIFSCAKQVHLVMFGLPSFNRALLTEIAKHVTFSQVTRLSLHNSVICTALLEGISECMPNLERLAFVRFTTDAAVECSSLAKLTQLQELQLTVGSYQQRELTDDEIDHMACRIGATQPSIRHLVMSCYQDSSQLNAIKQFDKITLYGRDGDIPIIRATAPTVEEVVQ